MTSYTVPAPPIRTSIRSRDRKVRRRRHSVLARVLRRAWSRVASHPGAWETPSQEVIRTHADPLTWRN